MTDEPAVTDRELLERAVTDPAAFAPVFERHHDTIHRYLARRVGPDDAEGLTAEVFVTALRRCGTSNLATGSALPWLFGIATNHVRTHRRAEVRWLRAQQRLEAHLRVGAPMVDEVALARSAAEARWPRVAAALATLSAEDRDALLLYAWSELSYADIAAIVGIPTGTVRSRIHRARRTLRAAVGDDGRDEEDQT